MSDFFEGLAARSSGAATALRPRVASAFETLSGERFEPMEEVAATIATSPATSHGMETRDAGTVTHAPVAHDAGPAPAEQVAMSEHVVKREHVVVRDVVLSPPESQSVPEEPERAPASIRDATREHTQTIERIHDLLAMHEPATDESIARTDAPPELKPETVGSAATPPLRALLPQRALPQRTPPERGNAVRAATGVAEARSQIARERPRAPEAPEAPVVQITIGRVEVRAVQTPPPLPRPAPPRPPGPTLEEFLEQRERRT
jgi:hypothetical protein